jgi:N-formylglutamate deformylase
LSDLEFLRQFRTSELDPLLFNHEAHLRLAWLQIDKFGPEQAIENIEDQLQNFVTHVGAQDKYHKTLTIAAVHAVSHFMTKAQSDNFADFLKEFPQLKNNFKELINSHYNIDIFNSASAKTEYIAPNKILFSKT